MNLYLKTAKSTLNYLLFVYIANCSICPKVISVLL